MTVEELKEEAKKLGYNLIPIRKYEKLIPCVCGCNRRDHFYGWKNGEDIVTLRCKRCGKEAPGRNEADARRNWNNAMSWLKEHEEHEDR